jgi:cupin superfamily acireductone dioxygenase involved in methionine salvage
MTDITIFNAQVSTQKYITSHIWDDDEVRFFLDQPTEFDLYSDSSLKQVCG